MDSHDAVVADVRRTLAAETDVHDTTVEHQMLMRPWRAEDVPWITNSWSLNARKTPMSKKIRNEVWFDAWHRVMEIVLPRARPLVACHPESPNTCFGWICGEIVQGTAAPDGADPALGGLVIHYAYVKDAFKAKPISRERIERAKTREICRYGNSLGVGRLMLRTLMNGEESRIGWVAASCYTAAGMGWLDRMYEEGTLPHRAQYNPFPLLSTLPRGWY